MPLFLLSCGLCYVTACQSSEVNVYQVACCQNHRIMASGPSAKRKRKDFTASEKVQVIEYKKEIPNASMRAIAEKFNCDKSQIQSILAKRTNKNALSKRVRASQMQNIDEASMSGTKRQDSRTFQ